MKKNKVIILIGMSILLLLVLSACSTQAESNAAQPVSEGEGSEIELPLQTQLIVGTFLLEDTDLPVNGEQAQEIIPLWKALKSLINSDSTSQLEIDALLVQIQESLTMDQIVAIDALDINNQSYQDVMRKYLPEDQQNNSLLMSDDERQAMRETAIAQNNGEMPANRGGSGVPGLGSGGGMGANAEMRQAIESGDSTGFAGNRNNSPMTIYLIDALIELLESK